MAAPGVNLLPRLAPEAGLPPCRAMGHQGRVISGGQSLELLLCETRRAEMLSQSRSRVLGYFQELEDFGTPRTGLHLGYGFSELPPGQ